MNKQTALLALEIDQNQRNVNHLSVLKIQGKIITAISESFNKSVIMRWSKEMETLAEPLYKFIRKAIQQQLPTASNLTRWGKSSDPKCPLCQQIQTNKHVLSNCSSNIALQRYTDRHDKVLSILTVWFLHNCKSDRTIYADLDGSNHNQVSDIFISLRPDIAIVGPNKSIDVLELTICHETNVNKSKNYKETRYSNLHRNLKHEYSNYNLNTFTVRSYNTRVDY